MASSADREASAPGTGPPKTKPPGTAASGTDARATDSPDTRLVPQFEVIPLPGTEEEVARHLPPGARVTVTSSPRQGQHATVDLARALSVRGIDAIPHLAARAIHGERELAEILGSLSEAGVMEVFVIAGDAAQPAGDFAGSLDLLSAISRLDQPFVVGVGGHPEGHPFLDEASAHRELAQKSLHASYLVTQMCFEAAPLLAWVRQLRQQGIELPVRPGVAAPVGLRRLLRIGTRVGVGPSLRMLSAQSTGFRHLVSPGTWSPDALLDDLADAYADPEYGLDGVHVYTFNALAETARWWHASKRP